MATNVSQKRNAAAEELASQPKELSGKKLKSASFGRNISEIKDANQEVYYKVASSLTRNVFQSLTIFKVADLALRGKKDAFQEEGTKLYANWRQARDGDRLASKSFPWAIDPKAGLEREWAKLRGTDSSEAKETFLSIFGTFIEKDEALAEELCLPDSTTSLEQIIEEAKASVEDQAGKKPRGK